MKSAITKISFAVVFFSNVLFCQIDADAPVDWTNVGYLGKNGDIPREFAAFVNMRIEKNVIPNDGVDDAPAINTAIQDKITNSPNVMTVFYFPTGTYTLATSVIIPTGARNILFRGDGANTRFEVINPITGFAISANNNDLRFVAIDSTDKPSLTEGAISISTSLITIPPGFSSLQQGDFIEIGIHNGTWLPSYKYTNSDNPQMTEYQYQVGQIIRVSSVSGGQASLEDKLRFSFGGSSLYPKVRKINTVSCIGFENFSIENTSSSTSVPSSNFVFSYTTDCWLWGIESSDPLNNHVAISASSGIEIRGCYIHHAKDYGGGGHGYGVSIGFHSTNCLIEDNVFDLLRHAMIISRGANGNVFGFNYSARIGFGPDDDYDQGDISLHGNYPFANLFEGNVAEFACADLTWGTNGPKNTLYRNRLTKHPSYEGISILCLPALGFTSSADYNGGIRIEDMATTQQYIYVMGNVVRWGNCPDITRAQHLPSHAVANGNYNAKYNGSDLDDISDDAGDLLWHFDGVKWTRDSTRYLISPYALWGTACDNIWLGSTSEFWRFDGIKWYQFSTHMLENYQGILIVDIWGTSANNIYGVGAADRSVSGKSYRCVMMRFNGSQWDFLQLPNLRVGFTEIRQQQVTGLYFISGIRFESTGDTSKLFVYDGKNLREIYTGLYGVNVEEVYGELYFVINKKIYKYQNNALQTWKDFGSTDYEGLMLGRNEKDFFAINDGKGIFHYNGSDLQLVFPTEFLVFTECIFPNDVFFACKNLQTNTSIVIRGTLKNDY